MLQGYSATSDPRHETFEFLSSGSKGTIKKIVQFQPIGPGMYNLAFGDWHEDTNEIRDDVRSNNDDRDVVLATVAATIEDFLTYHPQSEVFAQGRTAAHTRLYQMRVFSYLNQIDKKYELFGYGIDGWEVYNSKKKYKAFIVRRK